ESDCGVLVTVKDFRVRRRTVCFPVAFTCVGGQYTDFGTEMKGFQRTGLGKAGPTRAPALLQNTDLYPALRIRSARHVVIAARRTQAGVAFLSGRVIKSGQSNRFAHDIVDG